MKGRLGEWRSVYERRVVQVLSPLTYFYLSLVATACLRSSSPWSIPSFSVFMDDRLTKIPRGNLYKDAFGCGWVDYTSLEEIPLANSWKNKLKTDLKFNLVEYEKSNSTVVLLSSFHFNGHALWFQTVSEGRNTIYSTMNSTTGNYFSVAFIGVITLNGKHKRTSGKSLIWPDHSLGFRCQITTLNEILLFMWAKMKPLSDC